MTFDACTTISVQENALRGGIILADGTGEDITNGVAGVVTGTITGCGGGCLGDITEDYLTGPALINGLDLSALVVYLTPYAPGYSVTPIPAGDEKYNLNGDTTINGLDLSALIVHLTSYAPGYATSNCMP